MTKQGTTLIAPLIDRSGSIQNVREDYEGGLNKLIEDQRKVPGEAIVTLAQFDTEYQMIHNYVPIEDVPIFKIEPRGGTALLDAVGRFVTDVGNFLKNLPEEERPAKVIVVVVTDGQENSSTEWTNRMVKDIIKRQTDRFAWEFLFLGANMDAEGFGKDIGLRQDQSLTYSHATLDSAYAAASNSVLRSRTTGAAASFLPDEKAAAAPGSSQR